MSDQLPMFDPPTLPDTSSATGSPGSAAGPMRSDSPDGPMINPSGPVPVRVSRFRALEKDKVISTNAIYGRYSSGSSPSAVLQRCLENKLQARMDVNGSPEYALTWKRWRMPAGVPICALRASARHRSGSGSIGWQTPRSNEQGNYQYGSGDKTKMAPTLCGQLRICGYPTPRASDRGPRNPETARKKLRSDGRTKHHRIEDLLTSLGTSTGYPNPAFLFWMMGFPESWIASAPQAMPSSRKLRPSS